MSTPVRIQLSRRKGWRMPPNTVKVDRSTKWGNPFVVGKHGTRERCVQLFAFLMAGNICLGYPGLADVQITYYKHVRRNRRHLRGKNLACWCRLCTAHRDGKPLGVDCADCDPCHVDPLLELANLR